MNAALTATTANTIKGTKPYLKLSDGTMLTNLNQLLGFSMPDGSGGSSQIDSTMASTVITTPIGMKFDDVVALVTADGSSHSVGGVLADDDDGDANISSNVTINGTMTATWQDGDSNIISDLSQTFSQCGGPYTLTISTINVSVKTRYGDPDENHYGTHTGITYKFIGQDQGICYIKPANMEVRSGQHTATAVLSKFPYVSSNNPGGYNPSVWEYDSTSNTHKGFSVKNMRNLGKKFPTVGFYKASYDIIGSGSDQRYYKCETTSSDITLSGGGTHLLGKNCHVTYSTITKPADYTIIMKYTPDNGTTWLTIDSYYVPRPTHWVRVLGGEKYNSSRSTATNPDVYAAANLCANYSLTTTMDPSVAKGYFFPRSTWTNTPKISSNDNYLGYFSRDIDGTFMGEWGSLNNGSWGSSYSGSKFELYKQVWTSEDYNSTQMFIIHTFDGDQSYTYADGYAVVACRN